MARARAAVGLSCSNTLANRWRSAAERATTAGTRWRRRSRSRRRPGIGAAAVRRHGRVVDPTRRESSLRGRRNAPPALRSRVPLRGDQLLVPQTARRGNLRQVGGCYAGRVSLLGEATEGDYPCPEVAPEPGTARAVPPGECGSGTEARSAADATTAIVRVRRACDWPLLFAPQVTLSRTRCMRAKASKLVRAGRDAAGALRGCSSRCGPAVCTDCRRAWRLAGPRVLPSPRVAANILVRLWPKRSRPRRRFAEHQQWRSLVCLR